MGIFFGTRAPQPRRGWGSEPPVPGIYGGLNDSYDAPAAEMAVPTVYGCVSLVSEAVGMLAWERYRRSLEVNAGLPPFAFMDSPAPKTLPIVWKSQVIASAMLRGNAIGRVLGLDSNGLPKGIVLLNPDRVTAIDRDDEPLAFRFPNGKLEYTWPDGPIWHMPGLTLPGRRLGLSPIAMAAASIGIDIGARRFGGEFFNGSNIPKAIVSVAGKIDQTQAQTIKQRIITATQTREPLVMGDGANYKPLTVAPNEAQFLETQKFSVAQICRFFKVPPEMIGGANDGNSMQYSNRENRSIDFLTYTIQPWLTRVEESFYQLLPGGQGLRFRTGDLLRTDAETRAKVHNQMIAGKYETPTEARAEYGLPPMTDDQLAEVNMVPLTVTPMGGVKALPGIADPSGEPADLPEGDDPSNDKEPVDDAA